MRFKDFIAERWDRPTKLAPKIDNPKKSDFKVVYGKKQYFEDVIVELYYKGKIVQTIGVSIPELSKMDLRYFEYFPKVRNGRPYISDWRRSYLTLDREMGEEDITKIGMVVTHA